jgi:hypothetical protein
MLQAEPWNVSAFVCCSFAIWRITALVLYEPGPFGLLTRLRHRLVRGGFETLVTCFHCSSFWTSVAVVLLVYSPAFHWLLLIPATAGAASFLELRADRSQEQPQGE